MIAKITVDNRIITTTTLADETRSATTIIPDKRFVTRAEPRAVSKDRDVNVNVNARGFLPSCYPFLDKVKNITMTKEQRNVQKLFKQAKRKILWSAHQGRTTTSVNVKNSEYQMALDLKKLITDLGFSVHLCKSYQPDSMTYTYELSIFWDNV